MDSNDAPGASPEPGNIVALPQRTLVEFPLSAASFCGLRVPVCGGGYPDPAVPADARRSAWEVDPEQPRVKIGALSRFRHYTNFERCTARLARVLDDFAFASMRQVLTLCGILPGNSVALPQASQLRPKAAAVG
jgi:hypothetical protein